MSISIVNSPVARLLGFIKANLLLLKHTSIMSIIPKTADTDTYFFDILVRFGT